MENITVTINDKKIITQKGKTILQVVRENELDNIPTLCHDDRIEPYGSCYLCVVEVQGMNRLVPSCATPVNDGMVVFTNNEKIRDSRKAALELLFSNHYADCVGPCTNNCPAHVDAQGYIALISMGKYEKAVKLIKKDNPLPLSIGRVCVRNCEDACRRCHVDEVVNINYLKRYVADIDNKDKWQPDKKKSNGKKIAIIGGGPAGLTCAYYLTLDGYSTTIFEKLPELGGMLKYGIPEYRLPKETLDSEIKWITDLGIEVKTNIEMGKDFDINSLKENGYDALFLSVGAHKASAMGLENEDKIKGIFRGIDFLREIETKSAVKLKGTAVIVGGGNTAIDAARTALRLGADKVKIVYRRSINEMPAHPSEINAAQEEGVEINFLTNPKSIISKNGKLKAIECVKMELVEGKAGDRPRPVVIPGSEFTMNCDYLISAIGQQVDLSFIEKDPDCKMEKWGTVIVNKNTYETTIPGVFAGGDVVSGPLTAVSAIGQGKRAALSIDEYLRTGVIKKQHKNFYSFKHRFGELPESEFSQYVKREGETMPELKIEERINNFKEVELGLSDEQALNEAFRCLECGCSEYYDCVFRKYADDYEIDIADYLGEVRKFKVDKRHPFITFDPNKCINCGKCVRICSEILQVSALGFVNRGFKSVVKPAMEKPLLETNCIACGNCIDVCPTGAISEKFPHKILGTMPKLNHRSVCNFCSIGCNVNFKVVDNDIFYASNSTEEIINSKNNGYLCVKGRFGHRYLLDKENRFESPAINENGSFKNTTLDEAIDYSVETLKIIREKHGNDSVAVFASPKLSNEELYLLQKFTRAGLKTNNISSFSNMLYDSESNCLDEYLGATVSTVTMDDLKSTDIIVVINTDTEENLILELKIKEAVKKGAKLVIISSSETNLSKSADLWLDTRKGTNTILINAMINGVITTQKNYAELKKMVAPFDAEAVVDFAEVEESKFKKLLNYIKEPNKNIVFVYNIDSLKEKSNNDLQAVCNFMAVTNRINKENNGILIIREFSNSTGLQDMGVNPKYLPGYVKFDEKNEIKKIGNYWSENLEEIFKPVNLLQELSEGKIKAVVLVGENPKAYPEYNKYFKNVEFVLAMDSFNTETIQEADVVIPLSTSVEQTGTYTSCDTKIQKAKPVINKRNNLENWEIFSKLAKNFGNVLNFESYDVLFDEITKVNRIFACTQVEDYWNRNTKIREILREQRKLDYFIYKIDVETFNPVKAKMHYSDEYFSKFIKNRITVSTKINESSDKIQISI